MSGPAASFTVPAPPREPVRGARWRRWLVRVAGALAVLVGLAAGAGILASRELNSNLTGEQALRTDSPLPRRTETTSSRASARTTDKDRCP
ncbi:MAG: hypothetical protein M3P96_10210 [Actinomycetota bacterium]|nr:hypothetical protein [Actinomycetota bacterium]